MRGLVSGLIGFVERAALKFTIQTKKFSAALQIFFSSIPCFLRA
ncbi:hypothetical protein WSK_1745 [Novosphingobium sp. Rr 2-17]|nr:hypothetical protein WSK_1745 [Novosphingobium sp. Rr 2-17]